MNFYTNSYNYHSYGIHDWMENPGAEWFTSGMRGPATKGYYDARRPCRTDMPEKPPVAEMT